MYLPTHELLTIYPGFVPLYETRDVEFEETWRDTCLLLGAPALRGPRRKAVASLLEPLEEQLGGRVLERSGRFYLAPTAPIKMRQFIFLITTQAKRNLSSRSGIGGVRSAT